MNSNNFEFFQFFSFLALLNYIGSLNKFGYLKTDV